MSTDFSPLEARISVRFRDRALLEQAFMHRSYLNENPNITLGHNERLEVPGDAVPQELGMNEHLLLSRGEAKDEGRARQVILANTYEAVVGALYLDQGYACARDFITAHLIPRMDCILAENLWLDAKSFFQEKAQEKEGVTPSYHVLAESGPDHNKKFTVGIYIGSEQVAQGNGHSKQEAEQDAARKALAKKRWNVR